MNNDKSTNILDSHYYKLCKLILKLIGLWPFQSKFQKIIRLLVFIIIHLTLLLPQILAMTHDLTFVVAVENTFTIIFILHTVFVHTYSACNSSQFSILFTQIAKDWKKISDKHELEIMYRYAEIGRMCIVIFTSFSFTSWIVFNMTPFITPFLNIVYPLENGSHPVIYPAYCDYIFFDQIDYHYEICFHTAIVYFFSTCICVGIDTFYLASLQHICGLLAVICYRLENLGKPKNNRSIITKLKSDHMIQGEIVETILLQTDTIRFRELVQNCFGGIFFGLQLVCMIGLGFAQFYMITLFDTNKYLLIRIFGVYAGIALHLFYLHWVGQKIITSSERLFNSTYFSEWYQIPVKHQKMAKLIMVRTMYPLKFTAGGLIPFSMESFGIMTKTSMSYSTFLLSFR